MSRSDQLDCVGSDLAKHYDDLVVRSFFSLNDREQEILVARYRGETLEQVGGRMDVTRERVRQIQERATNRLVQDFMKSAYEVVGVSAEQIKAQEYVHIPSVVGQSAGSAAWRITAEAVLTKHGLSKLPFSDDWWVRDRGAVLAVLRELVVPGPVEEDDWNAECERSGIPSEVIVEAVGSDVLPVERYGGYIIRKRRGRRDRIHVHLLIKGQAPIEDLLDVVNETSVHALSEFLRRQEVFEKPSISQDWTLAGLVDQKYRSALPAVLDTLEEAGPLTFSELCEEVKKVHPVSNWRVDQCLDDYRIGELGDGRIWLVEHGAHKPAESEPKCPEHMKDSGSVVGVRRQVTSEARRGSGLMDNRWLAWRLGLRATPEKRVFRSSVEMADLTIQRAGRNSSISSIRGAIEARDLKIGCRVILLLYLENDTWELKHVCEPGMCEQSKP